MDVYVHIIFSKGKVTDSPFKFPCKEIGRGRRRHVKKGFIDI
jgi:hypothetical protein